MNRTDFINLKQKIDDLIVAYNVSRACSLLKRLKVADIPREVRKDFAQLSRRAGLFSLAVKILRPLIFENPSNDPFDQLEYAASIRKLGAK